MIEVRFAVESAKDQELPSNKEQIMQSYRRALTLASVAHVALLVSAARSQPAAAEIEMLGRDGPVLHWAVNTANAVCPSTIRTIASIAEANTTSDTRLWYAIGSDTLSNQFVPGQTTILYRGTTYTIASFPGSPDSNLQGLDPSHLVLTDTSLMLFKANLEIPAGLEISVLAVDESGLRCVAVPDTRPDDIPGSENTFWASFSAVAATEDLVAIMGRLSSSTQDDFGLWSGPVGDLSKVFRYADAPVIEVRDENNDLVEAAIIPNTPSSGPPAVLDNLTINKQGSVVFSTRIDVGETPHIALWIKSDTGIGSIACTLEKAPGFPENSGYKYNGFHGWGMNCNSDVVFIASVTDGTTTKTALYRKFTTDTAPVRIATEGDAMPGFTGHVIGRIGKRAHPEQSLPPSNPAVNVNRSIAFVAEIDDLSGRMAALCVTPANELHLVARDAVVDDTVIPPVCERMAAEDLNGFYLSTIDVPVMNDHDVICYQAVAGIPCVGSECTTGVCNITGAVDGIWTYEIGTETTSLVTRSGVGGFSPPDSPGDPVSLRIDGAAHTSGGSDGRSRTLNNNGDLLVYAGFTTDTTPYYYSGLYRVSVHGDAQVDGCGGLCLADINGDGSVDGADVEAFFLYWEASDPRADVDCSGGIDGADVELFFIHWEAGC